jgi:glyoxylase I family protein
MTRTAVALAGFHHVSLTVTDVARSEQWYGEVLGLHRAFVEQRSDGHAVVLSRPPMFLGLTQHDRCSGDPFDERRTGLDHVSFAVTERAELDAWAAHLDRVGVAFSGITEQTEPFPFALLVFRDPDGVQLEVTWS